MKTCSSTPTRAFTSSTWAIRWNTPRAGSRWCTPAWTICRIASSPRARAGSGPARRSPCCSASFPMPRCCRSATWAANTPPATTARTQGKRPPMKPIEIAKQREAIHLLQDEILSAKAFQFKPELLRHLAPRALARSLFLVLLRALSISVARARAFHPTVRGIAASGPGGIALVAG